MITLHIGTNLIVSCPCLREPHILRPLIILIMKMKLKLNSHLTKFAIPSLRWISCSYSEQFGSDWEKISSYLNKLKSIERSRGTLFAVRYNKKVRNIVLSYLAGSICKEDGVSVFHDGLPRALGPVVNILRSSPTAAQLRWILTSLCLTRALAVNNLANVETITSPPLREVDLCSFAKSRKLFIRALGLRKRDHSLPSRLRWKKFHFSTRSGPNGQAMYTSTRDINSIPEDLFSDICHIGGQYLEEKMNTLKGCSDLVSDLGLPTQKGRYRKITSFCDGEDKVRIVAILDYFSQSSLKPLHSELYRILRRIPQDCTFNQSGFKSKIDFSSGYFNSADLTAFTDRFPMELCTFVLKGYLPNKYVDSWSNIMVKHPFEYKQHNLSYAVGNPMGAYSSWGSMTLAHHFVMFHCCLQLGISWKSAPYVMLGDDIVITSEPLAKMYYSVIESLGVEISVKKSHISPHMFEFAKRIFYHGEEISPFPLKGLNEVKRRYNLLTALLIQERERGWEPREGIPHAVEDFYRKVISFRKKTRLSLGKKSSVCEYVTLLLQKKITSLEAFNGILGGYDLPLIRDISEEIAGNIFSNIAVQCFAESSESKSRDGLGLGDLAVNLVCQLTTEDSMLRGGLELIYAIPILQIHGQIEEIYMDLKREAFRIDTREGGDWPLLLRAMTIPISDSIYVKRNFDLLPSASARIAKVLTQEKVPELLHVWGFSTF